jgi:hypothetical protein
LDLQIQPPALGGVQEIELLKADPHGEDVGIRVDR